MDQMKEGGKCMNCDGGGCGCRCMHHKVVPALVVLFGALFLAENMGWVGAGTAQTWWPTLVIAAGLMKLSKGMCKCC